MTASPKDDPRPEDEQDREPDPEPTDDHEPPPGGLDRRKFLKGMGAAGVVGAAGAAGLNNLHAGPAESAAPFVATGPQQIAGDVPRPEDLRPGAQLDCRWPVTYEETIPRSVELVTRFFSAWSRQDLEGLAEVMHFPFAIVEQDEPIVFETADDFLANPPMTLAPEDMEVDHPGHFTGRIAPGSYNLFHSIDVPLFCPVGSATTLSFHRYSAGGNKLLECEGLFAVTNNDGRWGVELVSTIMKPTPHVDVPQPDAEMAAVRAGQDSMLRYTNRHRPRPETDPDERFFGRSARVSFGYGPRSRAGDARNDDPTAGWEIEGVESRLSISETTPDDPVPEPGEPDPENPMFTRSYDFAQFAEWAGGNVGPYGDTWTNPYTPRVLGDGRHADRQKAHTMGGYIRHTPDLTTISETRGVSIRVYRNGRWGSGGGISQVTYHDRSNSYPYVGA